MANSSRNRPDHQSAKPRPDFPLTAHPSGRWCKKVRGKVLFFGKIDDPQAALNRWVDEKDDLLAGRVPRSRKVGNEPTLRELCNAFMTTKQNLMESGELSVHSWRDYFRVCETLVATFGKERLLTDLLPEDFEQLRTSWAAKWGPVRLGNEINRARVVFNYAYKNGLLDRPMRYGEGFRRPSKKTLRRSRAEKGIRMFEADELQSIINGATQPMRAMLLLAINAGMGNNDVGQMPISAADLKGGWIDFPRPKTGIARRCPLWPETIKALRDWLKKRPVPKDEANAGLLFITAKGGSWSKNTSDNPVSKETRKLLDELKINGSRNFYAIRHTFETVAGDAKDQIAVNAIMGHVDDSMSAAYRERISDERLQAVVKYVHNWLYAKKRKEKAKR